MVNSDVSEIKNRLNIVDVLGEYIRLEKAGANYRALCPFHNEKTPSFMVSEDRQSWHCFGCQKGGDIFSFVMEIDGLEFREALKLLAEKAGIKLTGYDPKKAEESSRAMEILELATKFYEIQLWKGHGKDKILNYLKDRGLKDGIIREFRLGYAPPGWRNILTFLTDRGYKIEEISKTGLLVEKTSSQKPTTNNRAVSGKSSIVSKCYDRFRDRVIFPIADAQGRIVGYSARVAPGSDESQAKYINTPETEVYHKSRILYGIDRAKNEIKREDWALLVEGNLDVIAAAQAGIKNAIAVSGTALTSEQIQIIKRYCHKIKMFFDMDSAGEAATRKSLRLALTNEMGVEIVSLPSGKDAAELAKDDPEALVGAVRNSKNVAQHFFDIALSRYDKNKIEDKKKIVEYLTDIITSLENPVEKNHWIKKIAQEIDTSESALTDMIKKANLRERAGSTFKKKESPESDWRKKTEILTEEVIGLALSCQEAWKKLSRLDSEEAYLPKDSLLNYIISEGERLGYSFENLLENLKDDPRETVRAEKLFFEKKYRLNLQNIPEEIERQELEKEFDLCVFELKKEMLKEKMAGISQDISEAEGRGDKEAVRFLQGEFNKAAEELAKYKE